MVSGFHSKSNESANSTERGLRSNHVSVSKFKLPSAPVVVLGGGLVLLYVICLHPFLVMAGKVFFSAKDGGLNLEPFIHAYSSKVTLTATLNTLGVSLGVAGLSVLLAVPLAWLVTRSDLNRKSFWRSAFSLPYAIPPYIGAIAWTYLANPSNGLLNSIFGEGVFNVYTYGGLIWVMASFLYTFVFLSVLAALDRMDPSLEEAARLSGAGPFQVFFQITLPLIRPALLSGILLVVLAAAASFGVPALIGGPARIYLLTTQIYTFQKMGSMNGIYMAGSLSFALLFMAISSLVLNRFLLNKSQFQTVSGKTARASLVELGRTKKWMNLFLSILFTILFVLPLLGIAYAALSKIQGRLSWDNLGFQNFTRVLFETDETPRAFLNSFKLAFGTASIATILGMLLSYFQVKTKLKGRGMVEIFASLPYATPGTVLALAMILTFGAKFMGVFPSLYNTLWLIGIAYLAKYLNFSQRTCADGLGQIDDVLAEAARVSGANWTTTLRTIWFPLLRPSLAASWFLVFMPAFSELTMTILLTGPGLETLGTLLFQLQEYGDASGGGGAVLALFIVSFVFCLNYFVKIVSRGKYGL